MRVLGRFLLIGLASEMLYNPIKVCAGSLIYFRLGALPVVNFHMRTSLTGKRASNLISPRHIWLKHVSKFSHLNPANH